MRLRLRRRRDAGSRPKSRSGTESRPWGLPAVFFLLVYAVLVMCLPARLIVGPLGAPGTPAGMWATAGLVWWCCATLGGQNPVKGLTPVRILVGLLTVTVLVSYANGMASGWYAPPTVRQETDEFWTMIPPTVGQVTEAMVSAADRGLLAFTGWIGVALIASDGLRSWRDLDRLVIGLTWLGTFVATLGIIQFFTSYDVAQLFTIPGLKANADFGEVDARSILNRPASTAGHPIEFGVVLACLLPVAIHYGIHRPRRLVSWLPTVLIGMGCAMSVSRSGVLVAGVGGVVLMLGWPRKYQVRALVLAPLAVVGLRMLAPGLVGTIRSLFTNLLVDDSVDARRSDYSIVFELSSDHLLFGRGLFTFVPRYYRILDNQYLMILLELGLIGLLVALIAYTLAFSSARRAFRSAASPRDRHLGLVLSASIAGLAVSLLTFDAWGYAMTIGCTFLLFGMAGAAWRLTRDEQRRASEEDDEADETEAALDGLPPLERVGG